MLRLYLHYVSVKLDSLNRVLGQVIEEFYTDNLVLSSILFRVFYYFIKDFIRVVITFNI